MKDRRGFRWLGGPHAQRHAGASIDRLVYKRSLEDLCQRGRWADVDGVKRYNKPQVLVKANERLSKAEMDEAKVFLRELEGGNF